MRSTHLIGSALLLSASLLWSQGSTVDRTPSSPLGDEFVEEVLPFLERHCFRCHGEQEQKGGVRLDTLPRDFVGEASAEDWLLVSEMLGSAQMPPEGEPDPPPAADAGRIAQWLGEQVAAGSVERLARLPEVSYLRLSREEYANTIRDLLGVPFDVAGAGGLNPDDTWRGFQRIGSSLTLSPSHLDKYFRAAEAILEEAYPTDPVIPSTARLSAVELVEGGESFGQERSEQLPDEGRADAIRIDLWPGQDIRLEPGSLWTKQAGTYRFRLQLSGLASNAGRAAHVTIYATGVDRLLFEQDINATEEAPTVLEFEAHLPAGEHSFQILHEVPGPSILKRVGRSILRPFFSLQEGHIPWQLALVDEHGVPTMPVLMLDWVEWSGPLPSTDPLLRERFMPAEGTKSGDPALRTCIEAFATQAFRRPLAAAEVDPFIELIEAQLDKGSSLQTAVKTGMLAVLCSQSFLFLEEGGPERSDHRLSDSELAARLAYFLWGSMPDPALQALAQSGQLRQQGVLKSELRRLLADSRSDNLTSSFPSQWLQLERVGQFAPNLELYPDYDKHLERSMVQETTRFFGEVLRMDLSIEAFLRSDWTMLNARLAEHYGIAGVAGNHFRRVNLRPEDHRGGILTQASVLALTSDGTRHRPVHRGVWISQAILGRYPAPPPPGIDPIEPTPIDAEKASVREQLDAHKRNPTCFACHSKIDPLGFAFDNYDAVGHWRTQELVPTGLGENPSVDASGSLPDGRHFEDAAGLQAILSDDLDLFARAFIEKLATYALRRSMGPDDRARLDAIVDQAAEHQYRLGRLLEALVTSELFANR